MDKLGTFERKIKGFVFAEYQSGPKFRNNDTLVAKITPCLENGKTAFVNILDNEEIGYMDVNGNYIQNIASSKYLVEKVQKEKVEREGITDTITGVDIFELAKRGDEICIAGINEIISNLTVGVRNIIYLLNPEVIVIGGGITAQKEYLEEKIRKEVNDGMISDMFRKTRIELAQQGNQAGLLGALYNFLNKNK